MNKIAPDDPLQTLVDRAQKGDKTVLPVLREILKEPAAVDQLGGDLARQVQFAIIDRLGGQNPLFAETVPRKLRMMRAELAGPGSSALEFLLVERIITCWLHLHQLELTYASQQSMALTLAAYYQRSISAAQKRYLAAIKGLAQIRKLALPTLQVNIADKQVNVAK